MSFALMAISYSGFLKLKIYLLSATAGALYNCSFIVSISYANCGNRVSLYFKKFEAG
jgi:hypothetical protein